MKLLWVKLGLMAILTDEVLKWIKIILFKTGGWAVEKV